ncbi:MULTISPECIES: DUF550 domain-containing protein [Citrobacter freundii complex]|uniref:DUF550 domain-containing protein n=1 Tax=Citrobacter freundii complex TaxID=1344959 RepID=UPI000658240D|nr:MULTISPECIES: DUF550 domain-containing protein [Citrobacter freundii complex]
MTTNNHPANGPVSLDRLHQISEILSKAAAQSDGGSLGYAMADAVKVIDGAIAAFGAEPVAWTEKCEITNMQATGLYLRGFPDNSQGRDIALYTAPPAPERDQIRREHAEWSQATFGNVGPIGPLKHLSKEALEAAADPSDPLEWADMQFLLWDAQRRAGISDEQITQAMVEKLAVNKQREWPEPKDGEPRLHIKESDNSFVAPEGTACKYCGGTGYFRWKKSANTFPCPCMGCDLPAAPLQEVK